MTQPCNGCKALVIPTVDDYNLTSLQRPIYPEDPLRIIPQPNEWVELTCEDGFVIKKLFTQEDDWLVFWQQLKAECENHRPFADPTSPTVITPPSSTIEDVFPPEKPLTPNPNPDPVPGPGTQVTPPTTPPTESTPTPVPSTGPYGWPWTPPADKPTFPPSMGNPHVQPTLPSNCHWGSVTYVDFTYVYWFGSIVPGDAEKSWGERCLWADIYQYLIDVPGPYKYVTSYDQAQWVPGHTDTPVGSVHNAGWDFQGDVDQPYSHWAAEHQSPSPTNWYELQIRVYFNEAICT